MSRDKTQNGKKGDKRARWRNKYKRKHTVLTIKSERQRREYMSKTHSNEIMGAAKRIAKWLSTRVASGVVPTTKNVIDYIHQCYPHPQWSSQDQIGIGRGALALLQRKEPDAWAKFQEQNPDVMDREKANG